MKSKRPYSYTSDTFYSKEKPTKDYFPEPQTQGWTPSFRAKMNLARGWYGKPIIIQYPNGGYRTKKQNKQAGGVPSSYHVKGEAADIPLTDPRKRFELAIALWRSGITYVLLYSKHIHADMSKNRYQLGFGGKSK